MTQENTRPIMLPPPAEGMLRDLRKTAGYQYGYAEGRKAALLEALQICQELEHHGGAIREAVAKLKRMAGEKR